MLFDRDDNIYGQFVVAAAAEAGFAEGMCGVTQVGGAAHGGLPGRCVEEAFAEGEEGSGCGILPPAKPGGATTLGGQPLTPGSGGGFRPMGLPARTSKSKGFPKVRPCSSSPRR